MTLIRIDGQYGEGGGQILRTSVALAAITGKPVEIHNVRANRSRPGLQPQHLTAVRAAACLCGATLTGDEVGSMTVKMEPQHPVKAGTYTFDIGTAGATTLVAQMALVILGTASGESTIQVRGGTHNPMAPTADYLHDVFCKAASFAGWPMDFSYDTVGFYPKGGGLLNGHVRLTAPVSFRWLERGPIKSTRAIIVASGIDRDFVPRSKEALRKLLPEEIFAVLSVEQRNLPSPGSGLALTIVVDANPVPAAFSGLGSRGKPVEDVIEDAAVELIDWWHSEAPVDPHLADQLVLLAALTKGHCEWKTSEVTEHLRTLLWLLPQFLPVKAAAMDGVVTVAS